MALTSAQQRAAEATRKLNAEARRAEVAERRGPRARSPASRSRGSGPPRRSSRVAELEQEIDVVRAELHAWHVRALPPSRLTRRLTAPDRSPTDAGPVRNLGRVSARVRRTAESGSVIPEDNRFESDPDEASPTTPRSLPGWPVGTPDPADRFDVARLTHLLRAHERHGRGWAGASVDDVLVEVSEHGLRMRENVVLRDPDGDIRAWGSVHDRRRGPDALRPRRRARPARRRRRPLLRRALRVGRRAGARGRRAPAGSTSSRSTPAPSPTTSASTAGWPGAGFEQGPHLVADEPAGRRRRGRAGRRRPTAGRRRRGVPAGPPRRRRDARRGRPARAARGARGRVRRPLQLQRGDLRGVPLPAARGPRPPLGPLVARRAGRRRRRPRAGRRAGRHRLGERCGARTAPTSPTSACSRPPAAAASPRACCARSSPTPPRRGRDRVGLEVDADSPTGAAGLYTSMGWETKYVTESWHRDVPVD